MANLKFEVNLHGLISVSESAAILTELPDAGPEIFRSPGPFDPVPSNMIAQTEQPLKTKLKWRVRGALPLIMAGNWECAVYLEEMGKGEYSGLPFTKSVPLVAALDHTYLVDVDIPHSTIPVGLYRVTVAVTLIGPPPSNAVLPVVAFSDIGILRVYDAA